MTSALDGGGWPASRPGRFYLRERAGTYFTGGWVGPRAGLDGCGKPRPTGIRSPDRPAHKKSLYRLRYPGPVGRRGLTKTERKKERKKERKNYVHSNVSIILSVLLRGKICTKYLTLCSVLLFIKYRS